MTQLEPASESAAIADGPDDFAARFEQLRERLTQQPMIIRKQDARSWPPQEGFVATTARNGKQK